jgi:predicted nucleotidyltransferase
MPVHIDLPHDRLVDFCRRWNVIELSFFGSVLRDDFDSDSDVDVMVDFAPGKTPGVHIITMQDELEGILGYRVDLLTRAGVENSANYIMRGEILHTVEPYYAD